MEVGATSKGARVEFIWALPMFRLGVHHVAATVWSLADVKPPSTHSRAG